jgi:hypothetical protein
MIIAAATQSKFYSISKTWETIKNGDLDGFKSLMESGEISENDNYCTYSYLEYNGSITIKRNFIPLERAIKFKKEQIVIYLLKLGYLCENLKTWEDIEFMHKIMKKIEVMDYI